MAALARNGGARPQQLHDARRQRPLAIRSSLSAHHGQATALSKAAGEEIYKQHCAACHDNPEATKAPSRDALKRVSALYITNALIMGKMVAQGAPLSAVEVSNVSDYLSAGEENATGWIEPNRCAGQQAHTEARREAHRLRLRLQLFQQARTHLCAGRS